MRTDCRLQEERALAWRDYTRSAMTLLLVGRAAASPRSSGDYPKPMVPLARRQQSLLSGWVFTTPPGTQKKPGRRGRACCFSLSIPRSEIRSGSLGAEQIESSVRENQNDHRCRNCKTLHIFLLLARRSTANSRVQPASPRPAKARLHPNDNRLEVKQLRRRVVSQFEFSSSRFL